MYKNALGMIITVLAIALMYLLSICAVVGLLTLVPFLGVEVRSFLSLFVFSFYVFIYLFIWQFVSAITTTIDVANETLWNIKWISKVLVKQEIGVYVHGSLSFVYIYIVEKNFNEVNIPLLSLVLLHLCLMLGVCFFSKMKDEDDESVEDDNEETNV